MSTTPEHGSFDAPTPTELSAMLPRYEFYDFIAQGGMGAVYLARQSALDRDVAVKVLPPLLQGEVDYAGHLTREARAMARLTHTNIAAVHDFGVTETGWFYLVMEYVKGQTLHQMIHQHLHQLTPPLIRSITLQLCDALIFAHEHGILHRDVKPSNILINEEGRVKVVDFGLARPLSAHEQEVAMGTPDYVAPEILNGGRVDHRADIYALGVVLFEMLTGKVPWSADGKIAVALPEGGLWNTVVQQAMHPHPELRFRDMREFRAAVIKVTSTRRQISREQEVGHFHSKSGAVREVTSPVLGSTSAEKNSFAGLKWTVLALGLMAIAGWWWWPQWNSFWQEPVAIAEPEAGQVLNGEVQMGDEPIKKKAASHLAEKMKAGLGLGRGSERPASSNNGQTTGLLPANRGNNTISGVAGSLSATVISELVEGEKLEIDQVPAGHVSQMQEGHLDWISSVALFPDGRRVASASADGTVCVWDVVRGTLLMRYGPFEKAVQRVAISPDGKHLAAGSGNQKLRIWDADSGEFQNHIDVEGRDLTSLAFSVDGDSLLFCSTQMGASLKVWPWKQNAGHLVLENWNQIVNAMALVPKTGEGDGEGAQKFFTVGGGHDEQGLRMELWLGDVQTAAPITKLRPRPMVPSRVAVSSDGKRVAFTQGSSLRIVEVEQDRDISICVGHEGMVESIRFLQDGDFLISAAQDRTIRIWETISGVEVYRFEAASLCTSHFSISADERWMVSGGGMRWGSPLQRDGDYSLHVWRLPDLSQMETEQGWMVRAREDFMRLKEVDPELDTLRKQLAQDWADNLDKIKTAKEQSEKALIVLQEKYLSALQRGLAGQRGVDREAYLAEISRVVNKYPRKGIPRQWPPPLKNLYHIYLQQSSALQVDTRELMQQEAQRQATLLTQVVKSRETQGGISLARAKLLLEEFQTRIQVQARTDGSASQR